MSSGREKDIWLMKVIAYSLNVVGATEVRQTLLKVSHQVIKGLDCDYDGVFMLVVGRREKVRN